VKRVYSFDFLVSWSSLFFIWFVVSFFFFAVFCRSFPAVCCFLFAVGLRRLVPGPPIPPLVRQKVPWFAKNLAPLACCFVLLSVWRSLKWEIIPQTDQVTHVLQAIGRSEEGASEKLLPLVYAELRRLAGARMAHEMAGQTLQPTALVHEAWLRLVSDGDRTWQNRAHFFGAAAEAMRRILIERARHKSRIKRGGGQVSLNIEDLELAETTPDDKVLLIDEALERLKAEDPELERIVVLKFFGGLSNEEVAETLGLSKRTLDRQWAYARAWLFREIREQM